ncbi:MAG: hypothetical protein ACP5IO_06525 [Elusimicrobiales bacterium]
MDSFIIECPECGIRLEIDRKTGKIINSYPKPDVKSADAFLDMIKKSQENKKRLDDYFSKAPEEIKKRKEELEKKFEENKKKAKDDPNPPLNPMDLD